MIQTRRAQRTFGDGLIAEEVKDLHEEWMKHADRVLGDKEIVAAIYQALAKRHPQSRTRGRPGTPAEVVLRLLVLKHRCRPGCGWNCRWRSLRVIETQTMPAFARRWRPRHEQQ